MNVQDAVGLIAVPERNPVLGIDIDGTITDAVMFFRILTQVWPGKIYIITMRSDREKTLADLKFYDIRFDDVILVNTFPEKSKVIAEMGVTVFFDDQDEILNHVAENVTVFKIRNGGNYDFDLNKWLYSKHTGRQL
jgi:uncharacterized HAD superfamily protein